MSTYPREDEEVIRHPYIKQINFLSGQVPRTQSGSWRLVLVNITKLVEVKLQPSDKIFGFNPLE